MEEGLKKKSKGGGRQRLLFCFFFFFFGLLEGGGSFFCLPLPFPLAASSRLDATFRGDFVDEGEGRAFWHTHHPPSTARFNRPRRRAPQRRYRRPTGIPPPLRRSYYNPVRSLG
jgi:hypothetical protein